MFRKLLNDNQRNKTKCLENDWAKLCDPDINIEVSSDLFQRRSVETAVGDIGLQTD